MMDWLANLVASSGVMWRYQAARRTVLDRNHSPCSCAKRGVGCLAFCTCYVAFRTYWSIFALASHSLWFWATTGNQPGVRSRLHREAAFAIIILKNHDRTSWNFMHTLSQKLFVHSQLRQWTNQITLAKPKAQFRPFASAARLLFRGSTDSFSISIFWHRLPVP